MSKKIAPATSDELALLSDPVALKVLALIKRNHWLGLDIKELNQYFGSSDHPAKKDLVQEARTGGKYGTHLVILTLIFLGVILFVTSFVGLKDPVIFVMWAVLGVVFGLLLGRYPAHLDKLRAKKGS